MHKNEREQQIIQGAAGTVTPELSMVDLFTQSRPPWHRSRLGTYFIAAVLALVMLALRQSVAHTLENRSFLIIFTLPILASALLGGLGPGLTATAIIAVGINLLAIPPFGSLKIDSTLDLSQWAVLVFNGVVTSYVCYWLRRSLEEAKRGRALLQAVVSNSPDAISVKDLNGRYLLVNAAAAAVLGKQVHELEGKADFDFVPPQVVSETRAAEHRVLQSAQALNYEQSFVGPDGTLQTFQVTKGRLLDTKGNPVGVYGISRNITERKNREAEREQYRIGLEQEVKSRTQEYFELYDQAPCGYHTLSPTGIVLRANAAQLDMLGYTSEEFIGHPISDFLAPSSVALVQRSLEELLKTGELRDLEPDFICKDGSVLPLLMNSDLVQNEDGQAMYVRSSLLDNRELQARTRRLNDLNTFLAEVLEVLPFGVIVLNRQREVILHNKLLSSLFNYPPELMQQPGLRIDELLRFGHERGDFPNESLEDVLGLAIRLHDSRRTADFERRQVDGRVLAVHGQPITADWTLLTYTDISAHKEAEGAIQRAMDTTIAATAAKSEFIANMSHEIRTPMNAILGLSYMLEKTALTGDAAQLVRKIRLAGKSLLGIINDVLDFSKIESGNLQIQSAAFRLSDVLDNLSTIMSANAAEKDIELIIAPPPGKTSQLIGDSLRLEQVLINLTGNAIKFTERGHVALAIEPVAEEGNFISLRFSVRDSGIGIPMAKQQAIFAPFSQADGSTSRQYGGTGLGLTISRRLVMAMGGELAVTSVPGSGSDFSFTLRFERLQDAWIAAPEMSRLSVLIADDNAIARNALRTIADGLGWQTTAVSSGVAAVAHVQSKTSRGNEEVMLLDYKMPGQDGLQTARSIREGLQNNRDPIVILVTAFSSQEMLEHPDAAMADAILTKPVTPSALYNAVAQAKRVRQGGNTQPAVPSAQRLQGVRMLVVDDSEINREVAQRIFEGEGAQVSLASDGLQALEWLHAHAQAVDIVLMDVQMPVMNGYQATREIRRIPALAELPVVALSAGAFMEQQELANQAGMTSFIAKPFDVDAAIALVIKLSRPHVAVAPPEPASPVLTHLPGLAIQKGLDIWRDAAVYQKYLGKFVAGYGAAAASMRQMEPAAVEALAHKLRGAAANLALDDVSARASDVERTLRAGHSAEGALDQLEMALTTALASIRLYVPDDLLHPSEGGS